LRSSASSTPYGIDPTSSPRRFFAGQGLLGARPDDLPLVLDKRVAIPPATGHRLFSHRRGLTPSQPLSRERRQEQAESELQSPVGVVHPQEVCQLNSLSDTSCRRTVSVAYVIMPSR
jgi:hypothetical protein